MIGSVPLVAIVCGCLVLGLFVDCGGLFSFVGLVDSGFWICVWVLVIW